MARRICLFIPHEPRSLPLANAINVGHAVAESPGFNDSIVNSNKTPESFVHCSRTIKRQPRKFNIINQEVSSRLYVDVLGGYCSKRPSTLWRFITLWSVYFRGRPSFKCKYLTIKCVYKVQINVHFRLQTPDRVSDPTFVIMHFWHFFLLCFQVPFLWFQQAPRSKTPFSAARARARRSRRRALRGCSLQAFSSCDMENVCPFHYSWRSPHTRQVTLKLNSQCQTLKVWLLSGNFFFKQPLIHMVMSQQKEISRIDNFSLASMDEHWKCLSLKSWQEMSHDELHSYDRN